jgi:hypothetical protein
MALRREPEDLLRKTLDEMKRQIDEIDGRIEEEIAALKARLAEFQGSKKTLLSAYRGMARLLGEDASPDLDDPRPVPGSFKAG